MARLEIQMGSIDNIYKYRQAEAIIAFAAAAFIAFVDTALLIATMVAMRLTILISRGRVATAGFRGVR